MKCRLLIEMGCQPCEDFPEGTKPAGTEIEHPQAYMLVEMGVAEAVDEECRLKAPATPAQAADRQDRYRMQDAGILPEDRDAWARGWMRGYNPDGSWIPGPNADEYDELEWEEYKQNSPLVL